MNPYRFHVYCDICGGEGCGDSGAAAGQFMSCSIVYHSDPRVCAEVLKAKRRALDEERRQLESPKFLATLLMRSLGRRVVQYGARVRERLVAVLHPKTA